MIAVGVLVLVVFVLLILLVSRSGSAGRVVKKPERLQRELVRAKERNRPKKAQNLIGHLPNWSIRKSLLQAHESVSRLQEGIPIARQAQVPEAVTGGLQALTDDALEAIYVNARVVAATWQVSGINREKKLSPQTRENLAGRLDALNFLSEAARTARSRLGETITADDEAQPRKTAQLLESMAQAMDQVKRLS
jgi:hypothetical protein